MNTNGQQELSVDFVYSPVINFSLHQNHVPIIRKFIVTNKSGNDYQNLNVQLTFEPEFAVQGSFFISSLSAGESFQVSKYDIILSAKYLSELMFSFSSKGKDPFGNSINCTIEDRRITSYSMKFFDKKKGDPYYLILKTAKESFFSSALICIKFNVFFNE